MRRRGEWRWIRTAAAERGLGSAGHPKADASASTVVTKRMPLFAAT